MKIIIKLAVVVAAISLLLGIISRVTGAFIGPLGLTPGALLNFTNTCLLIAITLMLLEKSK